VPAENELDLSEKELAEAEERSSINARVVHEAVRREGEEELQRSSSALGWSGLAAGLSMGFSLIAEGILRARLPDAEWRPLVSKFGYTAGFVLTIQGRQQLFTENTLTPILPLLHRKDGKTLLNVLRLWAVVLFSNLAGTLIIGWVLGNTEAMSPEVRHAMEDIGREALSMPPWTVLLRAIFAGWLIAMLIWVLPSTETARFFVIVALTWLISAGQFTHIIAGSVEAWFMAATGAAPWQQAVFGYMVPTLVGNVLGGVSLVAALNHAQVVS
jgi:formate/nitrite transporter FocA (FNT family)